MTSSSNYLPATGFLRLPQIVGRAADPDTNTTAIPALIPVSRSTWWAGVRSGRYPQPVKLGERCTAWRVEDIRELIERTATAKVAP
ncbi:AlpA family phage regulatory protein [Xanthomonas sp. MUS 060]|uniref:helix-turn-helix transcriptional regulator n=1 Tax=Xanthomonas sp. MUS 060 TaxID=1588031 RepID=UPI0005F28A1B|nr:AlpA family phage regulatory protein [Xanthomonas sp. MUS 060]